MAQIKISNLTTYTGTTDDIRWFVINNSGNTETFKYSGYTSQLKPGVGTDSVVSTNLTPAFAPDDYMFIYGNHSSVSTGDYSSVIGGLNNKTDSAYAGVVAGQQNTAGFRCFVAGGYNNTASGAGAGIVAGESNLCGNIFGGGIFGSNSTKMYGGNDNGFAALGGNSNNVACNGGVGMFVIGGTLNRIQNFRGTGDDGRFVYGGIVAGKSNYIGNDRTAPDTNTGGQNAYPLILGGYYNTILGYSDGSGDPNWYNTILNSDNSIISGATTGGTIINSTTSTISRGERINIIGSENCNTISSAQTSSIISSVDTDITGSTYERVVMLGCNNRSSTRSEATFVENLVLFNYASLNFIDDAAAALGGVVLGQVYHDNGNLRVRIV